MSKIDFPQITKMHVKNYRSLADVDITLEPLTILVGQNGSGKSNAVDVLRFVRDIIVRGLDVAIMDRNGMSALRRWSSKGKPYDISISLTLKGKEFISEYAFTLGSERRGEYRVKNETLIITLSEGKKRHYLNDSKNSVATSINRRRAGNMFLSLPDSDLQLLKFLRVTEKQMDFRLAINSTYRFFNSMGFYTIFPNNLREPQKSANRNQLEEGGQNLASVLKFIKSKKGDYSFNNILDSLSAITLGLDDVVVSQVGSYYVTKLYYKAKTPGERRPTYELAQESDGTLRMLGVLTAVNQIPPRPLLAIEEPEATIHPGALGVLCDVINEASMRGQIILTTHSPELVSQFPAEVFRVVEKIDGCTIIGKIREDQRKAINEKLFSAGEIMRLEGFYSSNMQEDQCHQ